MALEFAKFDRNNSFASSLVTLPDGNLANNSVGTHVVFCTDMNANLWLGKYNQPTDTLSIYRMDPITGSVGAAVGTIASFGSGSYLQCFTYALGFLSGSGFYLLRVAYKRSEEHTSELQSRENL